MILHDIALREDEIAAFCERNHIRKLALFGSVLRDDFRPDSDIDVLVEFEPGATIGFIKFVRMQDELGVLLGRTVDLHTPQSLSRHFRQKVIDAAETIYERAG